MTGLWQQLEQGLRFPPLLLFPFQFARWSAPLLQVMTYGLANDDAEWVRKQFYLGVHGVIVDDVEGVTDALAAAVA